MYGSGPLDISSDDSFKFRNSPTNDRIGFVRKVLSIVATQLLVTAVFTCIVLASEAITAFVQQSIEMLITTFIISMITSIALICCKSVSRTVPYNYIALLVFTLCESYAVAAICTMYETEDVLAAAVLAACLTVTLTAYSYYCVDFEMIKFLGVSLMCIVILMIVDLFTGFGGHPIWIAFGLIIYSIYLIIDIQRIMDEGRFGMTLDDYIVGAMLIYLDIIMIFIKILELIGKKKN